MAFVHGKDSVIFLNENNVSSYMNNVDFNRTADIAETTAFGNDDKNYIAGDKDGTVSLTGMFDSTADGILQPLLGSSTDTSVCIGADGITDGKSIFFGIGPITGYGQSSPVGDVVATSFDSTSQCRFI